MKLITNETKLKEFIEWLPEIRENEIYYLGLLARSKYDVTGVIKSDKAQLKSITCSDKKFLYQKIKNLEGTYYIKDVEVPQESIVLYITTTPRNLRKATFSLSKQLIDDIEKGVFKNLESSAKSAIHKSPSKRRFVCFDVDSKYLNSSQIQILLKNEVFEGNTPFSIIETRGGYHVLINVKQVTYKNWYQKLKNVLPDIDLEGDLMSPVVGCFQGGFTPKLLV